MIDDVDRRRRITQESIVNDQIRGLNEAFSRLNGEKFWRGQKEHGGNLFKKPCHDFITEEILDLWNYHLVDTKQRKKVIKLAAYGYRHTRIAWIICNKILNLLTIGNEDGKREVEN